MSDFGYLVSAQPGTESVGQLASAGLTASQRAAQGQANADKARDIWRKRKLQSILSKHVDASGSVVNPDALFAEAAASGLAPEARSTLESQALATRENQLRLAEADIGLQTYGLRPSDSVAASQPGRPVMDSSQVGSQEERIRQNAAAMGVDPGESVGRSQAPATAVPTDGVRIAGNLPQMPEEGMGYTEGTNRNFLSKALAQRPDMMAGMDAMGGAGGGMGAQIEPTKLTDKDPRYVATVKDFAIRSGLSPKDASLEQIAGALDAYNELKASTVTAGVKPPMAFRGKDGRIDYGAWLGHLAEKRGELAKIRLETATEQEKRGTEYSQQAQARQATENATTSAQNAAMEKNAERQAIGGMIGNVNVYAEDLYGLRLDPAKIGDEKEAREISDRVATAAKAVNFLKTPGVLEGSWNKVLTEMQTLKGAIQTMDKIPGTESGERTLVNMLYPNMDLKAMYRMGWLEHGGLTEKGLAAMATQFTNIGPDEVRRNVTNMIKHSVPLTGALKKYAAGKEGPRNYGYASPETVANPFAGAPAPERKQAAPTPAEIAKMPPKGAREAQRKAFKGKGKKEAPARRKATAEDF